MIARVGKGQRLGEECCDMSGSEVRSERRMAFGSLAVRWLQLLLAVSVLPFLTSAQNGVVMRIDCGGFSNFTNEHNEQWIADSFYTGGSVSSVSDPAKFVEIQERTIRYFPVSIGKKHCYIVPVPTGRYFIRMFFVYDNYDHKWTTPNFDVSVEATVVFSWKSPWPDSVSNLGAYSDLHSFVQDGQASVCLYSLATDTPLLGALEILQVDSNSYNSASTGQKVILVNYGRLTGGNSSFGAGLTNDTDQGGRAWEVDTSYSPTQKLIVSTNEAIRNADVAPNYFPTRLYQSARTADPNVTIVYDFSVDSSLDYMIWFHFAEIENDISAPGQRVFNITVNNEVAFTDVDIFRQVSNYAALDLNYTYNNLSDTMLHIKFIPSVGAPLVNGLEVLAILPIESATDVTEASAMQELKASLQVPERMGWNGDPCSPSSWDAWEGVSCSMDNEENSLVIYRLDLSSQGLKGVISDRILDLKYLTYLNLSYNEIGGSIPAGLGQATLVNVDLSSNSLTGIIPDSLGSPQLNHVILNDNLLSGLVPETIYSIGVRGGYINLSNNKGLCGVPSLPDCPHFWQKSKLSAGAKVGITLATLIGTGLFVAMVCFCIKKRNSKEDYNFGLPHQLAMRHKRYMMYRATLQSNNDDGHMMRVSPEVDQARMARTEIDQARMAKTEKRFIDMIEGMRESPPQFLTQIRESKARISSMSHLYVESSRK